MSIRVFLLLICICFAFFKVRAQDLENVGSDIKEIVKVNGSFNLGLGYYNVKGIDNRRAPFSWYLAGAPTLSVGGFNMPFSAMVSEQERTFQQPFNQVGASPYYKWAKLHLGYRNIVFSDYTLAGATFLGGGIELSPGKFRFSAFHGRLRRAVDEDTNLTFTVLPSYKRMASGMNIGLGSSKNSFEISLLRSRDKIGSTQIISRNYDIKPEDNLVLGLKNQLTIMKKLKFGFDAAVSFITHNRTLGAIELEEVIENDFLTSLANNFIEINPSSKAKFAGNAFLEYREKNWRLKYLAKYVESDFISHGANYIQDDLIQHTLSPSFSLFRRRVNFNLSGGYQRDNLNNYKKATTERVIGSASVNFTPLKRMMTTLSYSNYGTNQTSGLVQLNDSIRMSLVNSSIGSSISYQIPTERTSNQIVFNYQQNKVLDRNEFSRKYSESNINFYNLSYSLGINKAKISISIGSNYSDVKTYLNNIETYGGTLGINKTFFKNKLRVHNSLNYQQRFINKEKNGHIISNNTSINLQLKSKHSIGLIFTLIKNTTTVQAYSVFNEQRIQFTYGFNF